MQVRLGNFGVSTKAVRTESNSRSTEARAIRYANYFLSEAQRQASGTKDDLFALGASIYATLVDTASQKFCKSVRERVPDEAAGVEEDRADGRGGEQEELRVLFGLQAFEDG